MSRLLFYANITPLKRSKIRQYITEVKAPTLTTDKLSKRRKNKELRNGASRSAVVKA